MRREDKIKFFAVVATVLILGTVFFGFLSYRQVPEGHEGVTKEFGAVTGEVLESGAHWKIPFVQSVQDVETRPRTYTMSGTEDEGEKDRNDAIPVKTVNGTTVHVDVTVRYRVDRERVDSFVSVWDNVRQMENRLIRPTVRSDLRDEASSLQTSEIYTKPGREALAETARESLRSGFADEPLILEVVQVRNINLPDSIDAALDRKERAKQQVQVEQEKIKQEEAKAEQKRVQARAEADVIDIRGDALERNPIVLDARMIEAYDNGTVFVTGDGETPVILEANQTSD